MFVHLLAVPAGTGVPIGHRALVQPKRHHHRLDQTATLAPARKCRCTPTGSSPASRFLLPCATGRKPSPSARQTFGHTPSSDTAAPSNYEHEHCLGPPAPLPDSPGSGKIHFAGSPSTFPSSPKGLCRRTRSFSRALLTRRNPRHGLVECYQGARTFITPSISGNVSTPVVWSIIYESCNNRAYGPPAGITCHRR